MATRNLGIREATKGVKVMMTHAKQIANDVARPKSRMRKQRRRGGCILRIETPNAMANAHGDGV